jgi:hypothetical protein
MGVYCTLLHCAICTFRYFEDLDPAVIKLQQMLSSGVLSREHIFYKIIDNALSYATAVGNQTNSDRFSWDPKVVSFCNTIEFHGGAKMVNIIRGSGQLGSGRDKEKTFSWKKYNIPLPSEKSRKQATG